MIVREIMVTPATTIRENCSLEEAAKLMLQRNIGCLPVVNEHDELCGIMTESDFTAKEKGIPFSFVRFPHVFGEWMPKEGVERLYQAARTTTVREIMSRNVTSLKEEDSLETVLERMLQSGFHRLPVVKNRKVIGVVARHDLLRLMLTRLS